MVEYACSVYFAHSLIGCERERAWNLLLDYQTWNPGLMTADVVTTRGLWRSEGEVVLIRPRDSQDRPQQAIYAETVTIIPGQRIVWFVYPQADDSFHNFLDFSLTPTTVGVRFDISWYSRDRLVGELLLAHRRATQESAQGLAVAFKSHCEKHARKADWRATDDLV